MELLVYVTVLIFPATWTTLGNAVLSNVVDVYSNLTVYGVTSLCNSTYISSNLTTLGNAVLSNVVDVYSNLTVYGVTSLCNSTYISSNLTTLGKHSNVKCSRCL